MSSFDNLNEKLCEAAKTGTLDEAELAGLQCEGADLDGADKDGKTALHWARLPCTGLRKMVTKQWLIS